MKLKVNEEGVVVVSQEGLPVWVKEEDGTEIAYDVPKLVSDLQRSNNESMGRRKKIEELENKWKPYEGFDFEGAKNALEKVKTFDENQKIQAGKTDEVIKAVEETYKKQLDEQKKDLTSKLQEREDLVVKKTNQINDLLIRSTFTASKFLTEKTILPPEVAFSHFGKNFKVEEMDGKLSTTAYYNNGERVYSNLKPGHPAEPEEALELIVKDCSYKDSILKGMGGSGTGAGSPSGKSEETSKSLAEMLYGNSMSKK